MKKWFRPAALAVLTTFAFSAKAQQYVFDKKIAIPGDAGYDYMAIDSVNNHLFVSHGRLSTLLTWRQNSRLR